MIKFTKKLFYLHLFLFSIPCLANPTGDKSALIIIDMQPYFVTRGGNENTKENAEKVKNILKIQNEAIQFAKEAKIPIIFLEYEEHEKTNVELRKAVKGYKEVKFFLKNTDGIFADGNKHRPEIVDYLDKKEIGNLIITGANGGACVQQSIDGALNNNYNVIALNKAIADFNYQEFIYPYSHIYHFEPSCESCKFLEVDDLGAVALELATNSVRIKKTDNKTDNTERKLEKSLPGVRDQEAQPNAGTMSK